MKAISLREHALNRLPGLLEQEMGEGRIPGAALAVGVGEQIHLQVSLGMAENHNGRTRPVREDTIFDLASLTKVMATLPAVLLLVEQGLIRLDDPVAMFLPALGNRDQSTITIRHLLTHTAGYPQTPRYYQTMSSPDEILDAMYATPLQTMVGTRVIYSDIGFVCLAKVAEAVTGHTFDSFVRENIFKPLGMYDTVFRPDVSLLDKMAATEVFPGADNARVGVVHDRNAEALGGVSGHAGLFAPLHDVIRYTQMWLEPTNSVLSFAAREAAVQCHTEGLAGRRGLGWVCRGDGHDHMGDLWSATSVGHTGFTGTSIAFDPPSGLWTVLLTNEIHYGRENRTIGRLRARVHNVVAASIVK